MKRNLYFIDETEKRRILNLHESRTKKQYLVREGLFDDLKINNAVQTAKNIIKNMGITVDNLQVQKTEDNDVSITGSAYENDKKAIEDKFSEDLLGGIGTSINLQVKEGSSIGWDNYPCVTNSGFGFEDYFQEGGLGTTFRYNIKLLDGQNGFFLQDGTYTIGENQTPKKYKCDGNNIVDTDSNTVLFSSTTTSDSSNSDNVADNTQKTTSTTNTGTGGQGYTTNTFGYVMNNVLKPEVLADIRSKIGSTEQTESPGKLSQTDINLLYKKISGQ